MLIICPDCGKSVSDQAHTCPECGRPLNNVKPIPLSKEVEPIQTIELTSKKYKAQLVAAFVLLFIFTVFSILFLLELDANLNPNRIRFLFTQENLYTYMILQFAIISIVGVLASLIWIGITRFMVWWKHR